MSPRKHRQLRGRPGVLLLAGLVAAATLLWSLGAGPAAAQEAEGESTPVEADEAIGDEQVVVADGHVDVGPRFVDDTFTLLVRDDTVEPSVWRQLGDVVLQATEAAVVEVPDDPAFSFLGQPGARVWLLPQVQQPGILWPGWNTQEPEVATTLRREVTWTLTGVEGPGAFVLFVNEDFGQPATIFDSRKPYPQQAGIDLNTHAHGNWAFTAPGIYRLDIEMSATTVDGDDVTASGALQLAVGDATDPQDAFATAGAAGDATTAPEPTSTTAAPAGPGDEVDDSGTGQDASAADGRSEGSPALPFGLGAAALFLVAGGLALAARARACARRAPAGDPA